ncbi:hypothetical protein BLNAU_21648 [Blattamonas nauphoetae]|uniref:Uncharacterized protein n=1 Tax=Blattamonas nauphoetae TaxID=2049346 RepID=A0ABQ9WZL2_9EUKA|nr:hypothetical protein BLNAU_21648 [Blattamonas nauphoetae]
MKENMSALKIVLSFCSYDRRKYAAELLIQQSPINLSGVEIVVSPYNPSTFQPNPNGPAGTGIGAGGAAASDVTSSAHHIMSSPRSVVLKGAGLQYG